MASAEQSGLIPGLTVKQNSDHPSGRYINKNLISIITPTLNRADFLKLAIQSFVRQDFPPERFEIIVVDNGSTDSTKQIVEDAMTAHKSHTIRYIYEPEPGLLSGRHRGALEAKGDILVFTDDDIEATPKWLSALASAFEDPAVHLAGGPSLPKYETAPPSWIEPYCSLKDNHLICIPFSLIDLGDELLEIDSTYVIGLNYAIRKRTLFELGGFHPDCIPKHLQYFQGDGETGLLIKIRERGYKTIYHPEAKVHHNIPSSRLTVEYFEGRYFYQGVCDSYTSIRKNRGTDNIPDRIFNPDDPTIPTLRVFNEYYQQIHKAYVDGYNFHLNAVRKSPILLSWVLKDDYFDYKLPKLEINSLSSQSESNLRIGSPYPPDLPTEQILLQNALRFCEEANSFVAQGNFSSASQCLDEAMYIYPRIRNLQYMRAFCLWKLGRLEEAHIASDAELNAYPDNEDCRKMTKLIKRTWR